MGFPLPPLTVTDALVPFAVVAIAMIGITIFLLGKVLPTDGRPPLLSQMLIALAVIAGGSLLLLSLLLVFVNPNGTSAWTWVLLSFNFMMMAPTGFWFIGVVVFRDRRVDARGWAWPIAISVTATGSEALMGALFVVADAPSSVTLLHTLSAGLGSIWFFWSMAAVMAALVVWAPLSPVERSALLALFGAAVVAPWVTTFPTIGGAAMGVLMGAIFALLLRRLLRGEVIAAEVPFLFGLAGAFLAMALAGLTVAVDPYDPWSTLAFGATMGAVMGVEIAYLLRRYYHGRLAAPWIHRSPQDEEPEERAGPGEVSGPRGPRPAETSVSAR